MLSILVGLFLCVFCNPLPENICYFKVIVLKGSGCISKSWAPALVLISTILMREISRIVCTSPVYHKGLLQHQRWANIWLKPFVQGTALCKLQRHSSLFSLWRDHRCEPQLQRTKLILPFPYPPAPSVLSKWGSCTFYWLTVQLSEPPSRILWPNKEFYCAISAQCCSWKLLTAAVVSLMWH